jgi:hypothetical protein
MNTYKFKFKDVEVNYGGSLHIKEDSGNGQ